MYEIKNQNRKQSPIGSQKIPHSNANHPAQFVDSSIPPQTNRATITYMTVNIMVSIKISSPSCMRLRIKVSS